MLGQGQEESQRVGGALQEVVEGRFAPQLRHVNELPHDRAHRSRLLSARSPSISATAPYAPSQATYAWPPGTSHSHFRCSPRSRARSRTRSASLPEGLDCDHSSIAENPAYRVRWMADRYVRAPSARASHHCGGFVALQILGQALRDQPARSGGLEQTKVAEQGANVLCRVAADRSTLVVSSLAQASRTLAGMRERRGGRPRSHARKRPPIRSASVSGGRSIAPSQCRRSRKVESDR